MSEVTSGILNSNSITGNNVKRWLRFQWEVTKTEPGKTTINWKVTGHGGSNTYATYDIFLNEEKIVSVNNQVKSFKEEVLHSGTTIIQHKNTGEGTVKVAFSISKIWTSLSAPTENSSVWSLPINYPYTKCAAPEFQSVSPFIQKPGGNIAIAWINKGGGIANEVKHFKLSYRIGTSGEWTISTTTGTSKTITLPTNAARAARVYIKIQAIGTVPGYDSEEVNYSGAILTNSLPGAPTVSGSNEITIPSTQNTFSFDIAPGDDSDTSQTTGVYYATAIDGQKVRCPSPFSPVISRTTTYYFWTYDGLEYSASYISRRIIKNSKPQVSLSFTGGETNLTVAFSKENGQTANNSYEFGYLYNDIRVTLYSGKEASFNIGDMRAVLGGSTPLKSNTIYNYSFWIQRNDGIELSDLVYSDNHSFYTPTVTLKNDSGEIAAFSKQVQVSISGGDGQYSSMSFENIEATKSNNVFLLNTSSLDYGKAIDKLYFNESFYIVPDSILYKVSRIRIQPSGQSSSPFVPTTFKPYTTQSLAISIVGVLGEEYGLADIPNLKITIGSSSLSLVPDASSNNDTFYYSVDGKSIYNLIANTSLSTAECKLIIQNDFGDEFQETFLLNLDFTEPAIIQSISLYPGGSYPPLNQWEYLKEGMPIYCNLQLLSFSKPEVELQSNGLFAKTKLALTEEGEYENFNYGDYDFNAKPKIYSFNEAVVSGLGDISQDFNAIFEIIAKTPGYELIQNIYPNEVIPVKAHRSPWAHFITANFQDGNLKTVLQIDDLGHSINNNNYRVSLSIQERSEYSSEEKENNGLNEVEIVWENFQGFVDGANTYEFLHIAPRLTVSTTTQTKLNNGKVEYSSCFESTKTTSLFTYTVVYNISPTVAYRKNYLGINTINFSNFDDAVAIINSYGSRKAIYLRSDSALVKLNLENGQIEGLSVDCGSW